MGLQSTITLTDKNESTKFQIFKSKVSAANTSIDNNCNIFRSNSNLGLQSTITLTDKNKNESTKFQIFKSKVSAVITKLMLVHLGKIKQAEHSDNDSFTIYSYFEKAAFNSSFSKKDANIILSDINIGHYFQQYLYKMWYKISSISTNPLSWKPTRHRIFAILNLYVVSKQHGNEMIWNSIKTPYVNFLTMVKLIRKQTKIKHSTFSLIIPKSKRINIDKLFSCILSQFSNIEIYPYSPEEESNIELIKLVMERYIPNEWPLDILLLLEAENNYDIWKKLYDGKECFRSWKNTLNNIPNSFKKYIKLVALFLKRQSQLTIKYTDISLNRIKCLNAVPNNWKSDLITLCTYCMECLTYIDINKRPASLGHYLNADTLKQYCHRDDSDRLILLSCFHPKNFVSLEIHHPDRHPITICQGKRSCFALVSFADRLCPMCTNDLNILDINENTCIEKENNEKCKGCELIVKYDNKVYNKINTARQEELEKSSLQKIREEKIKNDKEEKRRMYNRYRFTKAYELNQRRKLLK